MNSPSRVGGSIRRENPRTELSPRGEHWQLQGGGLPGEVQHHLEEGR
jgi:hypothetical protein